MAKLFYVKVRSKRFPRVTTVALTVAGTTLGAHFKGLDAYKRTLEGLTYFEVISK